MAHHEAPAWFVARLTQYPDFLGVRYNEEVGGRWEFQFRSVVGLPVSQFFGWETNPLTGAPIAADPVSGLPPFRDLDDAACHAILANCEQTYLGNRDDGAGTWKKKADAANRANIGIRKASVTQRGEDYAYLLKQVDLRRPWVKYHPNLGKPLS